MLLNCQESMAELTKNVGVTVVANAFSAKLHRYLLVYVYPNTVPTLFSLLAKFNGLVLGREEGRNTALVLGCVDAKGRNQILVETLSTKSIRFKFLCTF